MGEPMACFSPAHGTTMPLKVGAASVDVEELQDCPPGLQ